MKMVRAEANSLGEVCEPKRLLRGFDQAARLGDPATSLGRWLIGPAAPAGAEARSDRLFPHHVKPHIFLLGTSGGAGGPAIDAGGLNRVVEAAVEGGIACKNGSPLSVFGESRVAMRLHGAKLPCVLSACTPILAAEFP